MQFESCMQVCIDLLTKHVTHLSILSLSFSASLSCHPFVLLITSLSPSPLLAFFLIVLSWPPLLYFFPEIMSDEEAQTIVDQALKSGSLEQRNTVAVVVGCWVWEDVAY